MKKSNMKLVLFILFVFQSIVCFSFETKDSSLFKSQLSLGLNFASFNIQTIKEDSNYGNLNFINVGFKNRISEKCFLKQGINFTPRENWSKIMGGVISFGFEKNIMSKGKHNFFIGGDVLYRFIRNKLSQPDRRINTYSLNLSCNYSYNFNSHLGIALDIAPSLFNVTYQKIGERKRRSYYEYFSYKYFSLHIFYNIK